jgi:hypothetical protein
LPSHSYHHASRNANARHGRTLFTSYHGRSRLACSLLESWSGYSQHAVDALPLTRHLTTDEVLAFRDAAFTRYFDDPRYLDMVARTFGPATADEIRAMNGHRLARRRPAETIGA